MHKSIPGVYIEELNLFTLIYCDMETTIHNMIFIMLAVHNTVCKQAIIDRMSHLQALAQPLFIKWR